MPYTQALLAPNCHTCDPYRAPEKKPISAQKSYGHRKLFSYERNNLNGQVQLLLAVLAGTAFMQALPGPKIIHATPPGLQKIKTIDALKKLPAQKPVRLGAQHLYG